ncbi:TetR/AcrR family transcriptional regulator [Anaerocolumna sp. AGMB13020]|uniref:TetR/AcrR family transcriptional regulator n=1 Tax=Anaerocolumna sp. AGMB13020 TaxID=3081750 RepID=UPI0029559D3A|nr:TetR/AcrR family transcriptional regulator [Anaerocolumna sp. AGMB13020]WOO35896.1 TetR/AcrR family transcriptional regulator [Anaerocolumna sp. AGMB13020]
MQKEHYHHGDLKKEMIIKGIQLLNEENYEDFSLRKIAAMCGVSHSAPYKHFKNKDELILAIILEVSNSFKKALEEAVQRYPKEAENQIIELGKCYVRFMVENPDYMRFIFINPSHKNLNLVPVPDYETNPYQIFQKSALGYLEWLKADKKEQTVDILTMWSLVHGYSMLLVNGNIDIPENYLEVIDKMLREKLRFH